MFESSVFHGICIVLDQELQLVVSFFSQNVFDDFIDSEPEIFVDQIIDNVFHHFTGHVFVVTFDGSFFILYSDSGIQKVEEFVISAISVFNGIKFSPNDHTDRHGIVEVDDMRSIGSVVKHHSQLDGHFLEIEIELLVFHDNSVIIFGFSPHKFGDLRVF